jgi:hypothetical protein
MTNPTVKRENIFTKFGAFDSPKKPADVKPAMPNTPVKMPTVVRTMNDPAAAAEAARIYNPALPPMAPTPAAPLPAAPTTPPAIKPPTAPMLKQGTTDTLSMSGRWGTNES